MLRQKIAFALSGLFLLGAAERAASAAVCTAIDTTRDTLSEPDRNATRILLGQALRQQGIEVADSNCLGTYVVYHVKLGNSITVFMQGPQGYREASARAIEEIPAVYSQMIRSMLSGMPMGTTNGVVDRTNATAAQQAPKRVEADSLWYFRLGYGGVTGPATNSGPGFGFGYRYELDSLAIDLSFLNLVVAGSNDPMSTDKGVTGSWARLMALYYFNPTANGSFYLGGGLGYGVTAVSNATATYSGSGLQGEAAAGYEFLRASTIRIFAEAEATAPFYTVYPNILTGTGTPSDRSWVPSFTVSLGIGWGRSPLVRVNVVP
jgi:hypothetical protein